MNQFLVKLEKYKSLNKTQFFITEVVTKLLFKKESHKLNNKSEIQQALMTKKN